MLWGFGVQSIQIQISVLCQTSQSDMISNTTSILISTLHGLKSLSDKRDTQKTGSVTLSTEISWTKFRRLTFNLSGCKHLALLHEVFDKPNSKPTTLKWPTNDEMVYSTTRSYANMSAIKTTVRHYIQTLSQFLHYRI